MLVDAVLVRLKLSVRFLLLVLEPRLFDPSQDPRAVKTVHPSGLDPADLTDRPYPLYRPYLTKDPRSKYQKAPCSYRAVPCSLRGTGDPFRPRLPLSPDRPYGAGAERALSDHQPFVPDPAPFADRRLRRQSCKMASLQTKLKKQPLPQFTWGKGLSFFQLGN